MNDTPTRLPVERGSAAPLTPEEVRAICLDTWCTLRGWHRIMAFAVDFREEWGHTWWLGPWHERDAPFLQLFTSPNGRLPTSPSTPYEEGRQMGRYDGRHDNPRTWYFTSRGAKALGYIHGWLEGRGL